MQINLNNRPEEIAGKESMTVSELLDYKNYTFKFLVVRINDKTIKPDQYDDALVHDGNIVQVIHLISGG
jgi:sulfur carrier protein